MLCVPLLPHALPIQFKNIFRDMVTVIFQHYLDGGNANNTYEGKLVWVVLAVHILETETVTLRQTEHFFTETVTVTFSKIIPNTFLKILVTLLTTMVFCIGHRIDFRERGEVCVSNSSRWCLRIIHVCIYII